MRTLSVAIIVIFVLFFVAPPFYKLSAWSLEGKTVEIADGRQGKVVATMQYDLHLQVNVPGLPGEYSAWLDEEEAKHPGTVKPRAVVCRWRWQVKQVGE